MKRRSALQAAATLVLTRAQIAWGATIVAVRVWPAPDYTRVTIESDGLLSARHQFVPSPPRLAVDLEGIELNPALRELVAKVQPNDPNIARVRVGQFAPGVVRLVVDLKLPSSPQVFALPPVAAYQHRLVLDLYPEKASDPLATLIDERLRERQKAEPKPEAKADAKPADPLGDLIAQSAAKPTAKAASEPVPARAGAAGSYAGVPPIAINSEAARGRPASEIQQKTDRLIIIALDPGHGGEDPGAVGPGGAKEKDIVLQIAHRLRDRINAASVATGGTVSPMRAYLTRDADFFVPLHQRVQKARRVQADLFVSIHADAFFTPRPQGASVFALSQGAASSSAARWMADKENKADLVGGLNVTAKDVQVQRALLDMSTAAQIKDSLALGGAMLGEIGRVGRLHKPRVEQAGFAVLKAPDIPSVLVESAFISNPEEEAKLISAEYQEQLADALMRGIERYFAKNPPLARARAV